MKNTLKLVRRYLKTAPLLGLVFLASCYTDYGLDTNNYDVVVTLYDNTFNFQNANTYYMADSLVTGNSIDQSYKNAIYTSVNTNLQNYGWTRVTNYANADMIISAGVTSTTTYVEGGGSCYWDYWGYYWCYPDYGYDYSYTTGTLFILMNERPTTANGQNDDTEWLGTVNGVADQGNVVQRINTTVNQAFAQSPYLKQN